MGWGMSVKVLNKQKRVLHSIKGLHTRESCRPIFKELKAVTVTTLHIFEVLIYIRKTCISGKIQKYMSTTQEENVISMFQTVIYHSSRGV
jgi:hypothetical protein